VNPDVLDVYTVLAKNRKRPEKRKKQQLTKNKKILNIKMSAKEAQFLHLACQGRPVPLPPGSYVTVLLSANVVVPGVVTEATSP